jgi:prepilin-type N-terminal cleavage/methylation domain-containing protein
VTHRRCRTAGFTLLELLIVIGVILLLVAIAVVGFNAFERAASERQTKVTMESLRSLLAGYERQVGAGGIGQLDLMAATGNGDPFAVAPTAATPPYIAMTKAPGDVNPGAPDRAAFDDYNSPDFGKLATRNVMAVLRRVPDNKRMMEAMPPKTILSVRNLSNPPPAGLTPIVADGWGNPILFVPDGGLSGVKINGTVLPAGQEIRSPDRRPFFASAGPDGNFQEGDDNVYSFQN